MCTYYPSQICSTSAGTILSNKRLGQSKLDQIYSSIDQSYSKTHLLKENELRSFKPSLRLSYAPNIGIVDPRNTPTIPLNLRELGIGPYLLQHSEDKANYKFTVRRRGTFLKNKEWERVFNQKIEGKPEDNEDSDLFSPEDFYLKHYALLHPKTFPKMVRDGPPMQYRWSVWKYLVKPKRFFIKGLYEKLKGLSSHWETQISKDLHRTFPEEVYFSNNHDEIGKQQLFNVLKALSQYFPNIGYVQGMNFIAGFLLLVSGGNELQSFWMLIALMRDPRFLLMGLFENGFPLLDFYMYIFYKVLETKFPILYHYIQRRQLMVDPWLLRWFITIFVSVLPLKYTVRIWDFILKHGFPGMIRVAIGIMKHYEKDLMKVDIFGINSVFQSPMEQKISSSSMNQENTNNLNTTTNDIISKIKSLHSRFNKIAASDKPPQIKEFDIDEVLDFADSIPLEFNQIKTYMSLYEEQKRTKIAEPFRTLIDNLANHHHGHHKFKELQQEIDFHIIKNAVSERYHDEVGNATSAETRSLEEINNSSEA